MELIVICSLQCSLTCSWFRLYSRPNVLLVHLLFPPPSPWLPPSTFPSSPCWLCCDYFSPLFLRLSICVSISTVYFSFVGAGNCSQLFIDVQWWRQTFPHIKHPSAIIIISCWDLKFVFLFPSHWFIPLLFVGANYLWQWPFTERVSWDYCTYVL